MLELNKLTTEARNPGTAGLDTMTPLEIATVMNREDEQVVAGVRKVLPEVAAAGAGTAAFAVLFHVPAAFYLRCGVIGGCGWLCYRLLMAAGLTAIPAVFCATVLVVFLSRLSAVVRRCPVTLFLVPGIFPLVPGVGIYWTAYYLVTDRSALASQQGSTTLRSAVAIVLGILLVLELPQGLFRRLAGPFLRA